MSEMRNWRYVSPEASHVLLFSNVAFSAIDRGRCYHIEKLTGNILVKPLRGSPLSEASRMGLNLVVILLPFVSLTFNFGSSGGRLTTSILVTSNVSVPGLWWPDKGYTTMGMQNGSDVTFVLCWRNASLCEYCFKVKNRNAKWDTNFLVSTLSFITLNDQLCIAPALGHAIISSNRIMIDYSYSLIWQNI